MKQEANKEMQENEKVSVQESRQASCQNAWIKESKTQTSNNTTTSSKAIKQMNPVQECVRLTNQESKQANSKNVWN